MIKLHKAFSYFSTEGENPIILLNPLHIRSVEVIGDQTRVTLTNNTAIFVQETLEEVHNAIGA